MKNIFKPLKKVLKMWKAGINNTYVWLPTGMIPYDVLKH